MDTTRRSLFLVGPTGPAVVSCALLGFVLSGAGCDQRTEQTPAPPPAPASAPAPVAEAEPPPPPAPQPEVIVAQPGPDYFWISGGYEWIGGRWVWTAGRWERPPHPGGVWVSGQWRRDGRAHNWE